MTLQDPSPALAETDHRCRADEALQSAHAARLASIGQLAAGMAHEISNPVGYLLCNFSSLATYVEQLLRLLAAYETAEPALADRSAARRLEALRNEVELNFLKTDIPALMAESLQGINQVRQMVLDLKEFARAEAPDAWAATDLQARIDAVLSLLNNEIKYKAEVVKAYASLPAIECVPAEISHLFMNLLLHVARGIEGRRETITIRTGVDGDVVWVDIACGGLERAKAFALADERDAFPPRAATILARHGGRMDVASRHDGGTQYTVRLPITQPASPR